ncbi:MAG: response regulator [Patescibacteria group bacterium]|nr:response regulator [Patescibacteria group bacterium]
MIRHILIVDDDRDTCELLARLLEKQAEVAIASTGQEALESVARRVPDLILLDMRMPGIDGSETCRRMRRTLSGRKAQIIMVSACSSEIEQLRALDAGADDYVVKPIDPYEFASRVRLHFRLLDAMEEAASVRREICRHHADLHRMVEQRARELAETKDVAVMALAEVAESRDQGTGEHLVRMRTYAQILAETLRAYSPYATEIDDQFLEDLYRSSPLHDIGKVGISDAILLKPDRLTAEEFKQVKQHTVIGANILEQAVFHSPHGSFLAMAAVIARFHHERFDGEGYPAGLMGEEIPLPARIVTVADVFDAITSERPYKPAYPVDAARAMIHADSGKHFDPIIVDALERSFDQIVRVRERHQDRMPVLMGAMSFVEFGAMDDQELALAGAY